MTARPDKRRARPVTRSPARGGRPAASSRGEELAARKGVIATALAMSRSGLSLGKSGNVSCRFGDGMLITPTAVPYEDMTADDIVHVDGDGRVAAGQRTPSSEWHFHLAAYQARPDAGAVVHTHSTHATVLACAHKPIPAFHYMVLVAGGPDIPLVPYATFGTEELGRLVGVALASRKACLLANHGQIATGATLAAALALARDVEAMAEQYYKVLTLGPAKLLTEAEIAAAIRRFATYGQPGKV